MKRSKVILLCGVLLWMLPQLAAAQTGSIEGRVTEAQSGTPLPGVNVVIQSFNLGAATGPNGQYAIEQVPAGDHVVTVRFVGYRTVNREVTLSAGQTLTLDVAMEEQALGLDEVVVTGSGAEVARKSLGNTIAAVNFAGVEDIAAPTITDALAGKEAGVSINTQSGTLFQEPKIRIRGTSSLSMTNQPLVYVNGVRVNSTGGFAPGVATGGLGSPSALANINFDAIERVEILKGPAAATLYGSQANAGVIQIFTKQGAQEQAPQFELEVSNTFHQMPNRFKNNAGFVETAAEQQNVRDILGVDVGLYEPFESPTQLIDLYELGMGQEVSGSVRGGGQGTTYFANVRYNFTDGPYSPGASTFNGGSVGNSNDAYRKFFFTGNLNLIPSGKFRINLQTDYTYANSELYESGISIYTPTSTARYAKPERVGAASEFDTFGIPFFATVREGTYYEVSDVANKGRFVLQSNYMPTSEITIDGAFGIDYTEQRSRDYSPFGYAVDGVGPVPLGELTIGSRSELVWSLEGKANWTRDFTDDLRSIFVVGFQGYRTETNASTGEGDNFPGPGLEVLDATAIRSSSSGFREVVNAGFFAQDQLNWREYLYLTAGVRLDASSAFGDEFNYATYPKVAVSFLPTDAFGFSIPSVSTLRLRAAWGQSGQQPGAFDRFTTFTPVNSPEGSGVVTGNLGNQDLKPEVATEWEAGFEVGFFQDRLGISGTYWDRAVEDALVARSFVPSGGFLTPQLTNAGTLAAQGVELSIDSDLVRRDNFTLSLFANTAYLYEQVETLGGAPPIKVDASYARDRMFIREGFAPAAYFGTALPAGVDFPLDLERNGTPSGQSALESYFSQPRDPSDFATFVMVAGEDGSALAGGESYTNTYLGKPTPDWEGSAGFTVRFLSDFTLSSRFQYAAGNYYHHNLTDAFRRTNSGIGRNIMASASLEAVLKDPDSSTQERVNAARRWVTEMVALTPFDGLNEIEKADYVRWQNLTLSYNLPQSLVGQLGVNNASLTVSGNNLALWTRYGGVDPLATGEGSVGAEGDPSSTQAEALTENFGGGMDTYGTPLLRSYSITLRMGF